MNSLRARITLLLAAAIVLVVSLANFAAIRIIGPPPAERTIEPLARLVEIAVRLADHRARDNTDLFASAPTSTSMPSSATDESLAREIRSALEKSGIKTEVSVARPPGGNAVASVALKDGRWIRLSLPDVRPPNGHPLILLVWMIPIVIGTLLIATFIAFKMTKPLAMLERAVGAVGEDGVLPRMAEIGAPEIRGTARALNRLSDRLRIAMESRMRLVAAAGHDLRTPLTRMRLRAEFIEGPDRDKWLKDLDELSRIADSAIGLVREETNVHNEETVELDALIGRVCGELSGLGLNVALVGTERARVRAGPLALTRALRNLIVNAATHGGGARVRMSCQGGDAVVTIEDNGPGIPDALLGQVFEPFFRVDSARRQATAGAGLGLAIAKEIIHRLRGEITLANKNGGGLRQEVRLALLSPAAEPKG